MTVFFASTVAPGITAPVASETVPVIVPRSVCANAAKDHISRHTTTNSKCNLIVFFSPWQGVKQPPSISKGVGKEVGVKSSTDHPLVGQFNDADSIVNCRAKAIETLDFKTFTFDVAIP
ncbi:MAG: hypothetical protein DMG14_26705, partial [Acidobacteria bacterium]